MKGFLSQKNLQFEVRDITADESAQRELIDMGFTSIPVTLVGDAPPILGANFREIEKAILGS